MLRYEDDGLGVEKRVEFEADSPAQALLIAQGEAEGRWAELSADGQRICQLGREGLGAANYWVIRSDAPRNMSPVRARPAQPPAAGHPPSVRGMAGTRNPATSP